ncbi:hypothetical protein BN1095_1330001 [Clostridioides difficile]|uniref:Uncharacterized protein n=1 Tax=Clostridioides difficile TaxID=1496 RepID=A0A069AJ33_CLODI|nr:hypothetical protein BN1095_1330001 [Clostridioides difficile]
MGTGQDDRLVQTLQREGEQIGGIGERVRTVQHQKRRRTAAARRQ